RVLVVRDGLAKVNDFSPKVGGLRRPLTRMARRRTPGRRRPPSRLRADWRSRDGDRNRSGVVVERVFLERARGIALHVQEAGARGQVCDVEPLAVECVAVEIGPAGLDALVVAVEHLAAADVRALHDLHGVLHAVGQLLAHLDHVAGSVPGLAAAAALTAPISGGTPAPWTSWALAA